MEVLTSGMDEDDSEPRFIISVIDPTNVWSLVSDVRNPLEKLA